jgi:nucleoside-diphosphate-sugar epimerase
VARYVVTGAAGFLGSQLAEALLDEGHDVVAVDSLTDYYDPALKEANAAAFDLVRLDLATEDLGGVLAGADGVFHLAGQPGVRASFGDLFPLYVERNVVATQRVLEAVLAEGTRLVWASSSSVYGEAETLPTAEDVEPRPISPYGITKAACEQLVRAYGRLGLDAVTLRYFSIYGPRQRPDMAFTRLLEALAEGRPFELLGDGSAARSFTYVADAVEATIAAMEHAGSGAVLNVGGGESATMADVIALAERIAGRELEVVRRPEAPGDVRRTAADVSRIARGLGWRPATPLPAGLAAQWEWASSRVAAR